MEAEFLHALNGQLNMSRIKIAALTYNNVLLSAATVRLVYPMEGLSEGEPLLVELFDKDFNSKEFLGQVSTPDHSCGCTVSRPPAGWQ